MAKAKTKLKFEKSSVGSVDKLKEELSRKSGFGNMLWIKDGDSKVFRILAEPKDWIQYNLVRVESLGVKGKLPCFVGYEEFTDGGERQQTATVIPVALVNDESGKADRFMFYEPTKGMLNDLIKHYDRRKTVTDRDFEVIREGAGMKNTKYTLMNDDPKKRKEIEKLEETDFDDELVRMYNEFMKAYNGSDEEEDEDEKPKSKKSSKSTKSTTKAKRQAVEDDDEEEDDTPEFDEDDYATWSQEQLAEEADDRNLEIPGRKTTKKLIAALTADDESEGDEDDDEEEEEETPPAKSKSKSKKAPEPEEDDEEEEEEDDEEEEEASSSTTVSGTLTATKIDATAYTVDFIDGDGEVYETVYLDRSRHDIEELEEDGAYVVSLELDEDEDWIVSGDIKSAKKAKGKKSKVA